MIFMVLSPWQSHCESLPGSFDERRLSAEVAANPETNWANGLGLWIRQKKMAATVHIYHRYFIITHPESWYSFYHPTEVGRLWHCSKGVQPVPKAVYRSGEIAEFAELKFVGLENDGQENDGKWRVLHVRRSHRRSGIIYLRYYTEGI